MYKYEIENELKSIPDVGIEHFRKFLDKISKKSNKIILFKNRNERYSSYYCTKCKTWHFVETKNIKAIKRKDYITCGNCLTRLEIIYVNNKIQEYADYITLCESNSRNELIIRLFFYKKSYDKKYGQFYEEFYEVERINLNRKIAMKNNSYKVMGNWWIFHGPTTKGWIRDRSEFYRAYYYDIVYNSTKKIRNIIKANDEYRYSCLDMAVKNKLDILSYLALYKDYPKVELLMKMGCVKIIEDICKNRTYSCSPSILYKMNKKAINMLRKYNLSYEELRVYLKTSIEDYQLLKKGASVHYQLAQLNHNAKKVISYLCDKQYSIRNYEDYLSWCEELGMDMSNNRILYPDDPVEAHDRVFKEKIRYENNIHNEAIKEFSRELKKYIFKENHLIIRPVESQEELIIESQKLEHCVRSYAERIAHRQTSIFFIRKEKEQEIPYVTLELKNNEVIQCRAKNNLRPNDDTVKFVNDWCQKNHFKSCFS